MLSQDVPNAHTNAFHAWMVYVGNRHWFSLCVRREKIRLNSSGESRSNNYKKVFLTRVEINSKSESLQQGVFSQPLASISRMQMSTTMGLWVLCAFTSVVRSQQYTFLILLRSGWQSFGTCLEHCLCTFNPQSVNKEATLDSPGPFVKARHKFYVTKNKNENARRFAVSLWNIHPA